MGGAAVPTGPDTDVAHALALASLPRVGPRRFLALVGEVDAEQAWREVRERRAHRRPAVAEALGSDAPSLVDEWARRAAAVDVGELWRDHVDAGIAVHRHGRPGYPAQLLCDPEPPVVLFTRGDTGALDPTRRRVAIVGTRRCTRYGLDVAFELGRELARHDIGVVSGLALGIDAAAHAGALEGAGAPPVAVVATGLDRTYPRRNGPLARRVEACGLVLSEYPIGVGPQAWRFPARNRLIAALADVLVVVESHASGGSLYTVDEADRRDRPVLAVPGSIRSAASRGTNDLLADGRAPVRDVTDVLLELGLTPVEPPVTDGSGGGVATDGPSLTPAERAVLAALGWEPATLEQVVVRTGRSITEVSTALHALRERGRLVESGGWFEQAASS